MKNASETYGAARLGRCLYAARVENDGTRLTVTSLLSSEDDVNGETLENGRLFFNVDDSMAVVRRIRVKPISFLDAAEVARFELAQSLLEPQESFYFDTLPLESHETCKRYLTIAYHRGIIDEMVSAYQMQLRKPSGFKLDAVAMAHGYLAFCRQEPGDLLILVDLEPNAVSLAFLYQRRLEAIGRLELAPGEEMTAEQARKLAAEFKMTVSFHLAELFGEGISVPLSRVILSGRHARNDFLRAALAEVTTADVTLPHFNEGHFQPAAETLDKHHPEQFLIPLGLAVE